MDAEIEAYKTAWQTSTERNAVCQAMADQYVASHPELAAQYGALTIPQLVTLVDSAREAGDEEEVWRLEIWINAAFEYQQIGGVIDTSGTRREVDPINVDGDRR